MRGLFATRRQTEICPFAVRTNLLLFVKHRELEGVHIEHVWRKDSALTTAGCAAVGAVQVCGIALWWHVGLAL